MLPTDELPSLSGSDSTEGGSIDQGPEVEYTTETLISSMEAIAAQLGIAAYTEGESLPVVRLMELVNIAEEAYKNAPGNGLLDE